MDSPGDLWERFEQDSLLVSQMSREELIAWSHLGFASREYTRNFEKAVVQSWIVRDNPQKTLERLCQSRRGNELLFEAVRALRMQGRSVPQLISQYIADVYLGLVELPKKPRSARMPSDMQYLNEAVRDDLIHIQIGLLVERANLRISRNSDTKASSNNRRVTACEIVATALGNISEDTVKKIYERENRKENSEKSQR